MVVLSVVGLQLILVGNCMVTSDSSYCSTTGVTGLTHPVTEFHTCSFAYTGYMIDYFGS